MKLLKGFYIDIIRRFLFNITSLSVCVYMPQIINLLVSYLFLAAIINAELAKNLISHGLFMDK